MPGSRKDTTQIIMDGVLRFLATGGFLTAAVIAPNTVKVFEKPLDKLLINLDKSSSERELKRVLHYMKQRGLIHYRAKDYENGIVLTKKGKVNLAKREYETLNVPTPDHWDNKWRLVFFDIPEDMRTSRIVLTQKLRLLGFQLLQQSIWVHPFPCRPEIEVVTEKIGIRKYVTYVEISQIDGDNKLRERFKKLLS